MHIKINNQQIKPDFRLSYIYTCSEHSYLEAIITLTKSQCQFYECVKDWGEEKWPKKIKIKIHTWDLDIGRPMLWVLVMEKFMLWEALMLVLREGPMRSKRSPEGTVEAGAGANRSAVAGFTGGGAGCPSENAFQSPKSPFPLDAEAELTKRL